MTIPSPNPEAAFLRFTRCSIRFVDSASTLAGHGFAWLIVVLTGVICWEVVSRYFLGHSTAWVFDLSYMLYGTLLLMAGAYGVAKQAHVRGDLMYGALTPRAQASIDLALYPLFFMPGILALAYGGYDFALDSWAMRESSPYMPDGPPIYPLKTFIPLAAFLLLFQGAAEMARSVVCLITGEWPERTDDFKEIDTEEFKKTIGVTSPEVRS